MAAKKKTKRSNSVSTRRFLLNCVESRSQQDDFSFGDAVDAGVLEDATPIPRSKNLHRAWWKIDNQGSTGACVGFAAARGVLRWHYVNKRKMSRSDMPSARFIWMANKETDQITAFPTTFLESEGTQTKLALKVAQKYGCVPESVLSMKGNLATLSRGAFYSMAANLRILSYHNLGQNLDVWRRWIANIGPILTRLGVDRTFDRATQTNGMLRAYQPNTVRGGHAVCLVGYTPTRFIVRNSWGPRWGRNGLAYATNSYAQAAFTEAYGAYL